MDGKTGILVCLICSFCLIYGGEAALGDGCTDNSNCTTSNSECNGTSSGSVCICSSGYYKSGTLCPAVKPTGSTCDDPSGIPITDPCKGVNAQCVDTGGGQYKCQCPTDYYDSNGDATEGGDCITMKPTGSACDDPSPTGIPVTDPCKGASAQCVDTGGGQYKCQCPTDYYDSNGDATEGGDCITMKPTGSTCDDPSPTGIPITDPCKGANAQCVDSGGGLYKCQCPTDYYDSNGDATAGGDCVSTKLTGSSCDNPSTTGASTTDQCAGANARCLDSGGGLYKCLCPTNYYDDNGDGTPGGNCVSTKPTGSTCDNPSTTGIPITDPCKGANAQCVDTGGGQYKCQCPTDYYDSNGDATAGGDCVSTKLTGSSCDNPSTTGASATDQCAGANARCLDSGGGLYKCLCPTNYYDDNGDGTPGGNCVSTKPTGSTCDNPSTTGIPITDPCKGANAQCVDTGGGQYKCQCPTDYYDSNGDATAGGDCVSTKPTGSSCDNPSTTGASTTDQCAGANARCLDSGGGLYKCLCPTNYYDDNGDGTPGGNCVSTKPTGSTCDNPSTTGIPITDPCKGANAQCVGTGGGQYKCQCPIDYYDSNGDATAGGDCVSTKLTGSSCDNPSTTGASTTDQCAGANARCLDSGGGLYKCLCPTNYYDDNGDGTPGGNCVSTKPTGSTCDNPSTTGIPITDPCKGANAQCVDSGGGLYKCQCPTDYYDSNGDATAGGDCVSTKPTGSTCDDPSPTGIPITDPCKGANAQCVDSGGGLYKCQCPTDYYDSNGDATAGGDCVSTKPTGSSCDNPSTTGASTTDQCAGVNARCLDSGGGLYKCLCPTNYYDDNGDGTPGGNCVSTKPTGSTCDNPSTTGIPITDPCKGANAQCVDTGGGQYKCQCPTDYYDSNGDATAGGDCVSTKPTGSSCDNPSTTGASTTDQCAGANARCLDSGGGLYKCLCPTNYYDDNGDGTPGGNCVSTKLTGSSCDNPSTTGASTTDQCAGANARCLDSGGGLYKCLCPTNYYDDNGDGTPGGNCVSKVDVGAVCPVPTGSVPSTATCADSNAICFLSDANYVCSCLATYYSYSRQCNAKVGLGETCPTGIPDSEPCADNNARCSSEGKCTCKATFYNINGAGNTGGQCTPEVGLDETCPTNIPDLEPCADNNARCDGTGTCTCKDTFYDSNGVGNTGGQCTPEVDLGSSCTMTEACGTLNAVCQNLVCVCGDAFYDDNGGQARGTCTGKIELYQSCASSYVITDQCSDINAECRNNYRCECKASYSESGGICNPNQGVGGDCDTAGAGGACSDDNADCINNKCICNINSYDDDGLDEGGNCRPMTELEVSGLTISSPVTTGFTVSWTPPEMRQHVSGYTVQWRPKDNSVGGQSVDIGNATSYVINTAEVTAGQAYVVTVVSRNEVTEQGSSRIVTSSPVEQAAKPNKPGNIIRESSNFDAEDKWIGIAWSHPAGRVSGYIVKLLEDVAELTSDPFPIAQGNIYYASMLNGHRYDISITSLSESFDGGDKVESEVHVEEIKTIVKVPGPPREVICAEEFKAKIRLTWLPPTQPKGDIIQYHIRVIKRDSTVYAVHTAGSDKTTRDILGLKPGSYYKFEMTIENDRYNSSTNASTADFCTTTAGVSEPPSGLAVTDVTSRSVAFEWSDPANTYSEENLGYIVQVKDDDGNCEEVIYRCSNCFKSFQLSDLQGLCDSQGPVTEKTSSQLSGEQVYNATGLNPDILYTVSVAAINLAGKGQTATETRKTAEEVPAKPEINIHTITPTSFTVDWSIADPRPGTTTYQITVDTGSPALPKTTTVTGFSKRTTTIIGLEENWQYDVSVSARTAVGSRISDVESIVTHPSAPGKVSQFIVDRVPGGSYNEWKVTWKIPSVLERNSNITSYRFIHNGTTALQDKNLNAQVESHLYAETIEVEPEKFYSVEVYAVNVNGQNGESTLYFAESLAGVPAPPVQVDFESIKAGTVTTQRKSIEVTVAAENFMLTQNGRLRKTGLVCCAKTTCKQLQANRLTGVSSDYASMDVATWDSMPSWHNASKENKFTPWRPTKDNWVEAQQGRSKRATNDVQYHIGVEDCSSATQSGYCNGPLVEDMEFMVYVVLCTNGGCLVSKPSGPYKTKPVPEKSKTNIGMIVGIVVAVVVLIAVGLLVGLFIMRRRRNRNPMRPIDEELPKIDPTVSIQRKRPKKLSEINEYLEKMHKDSNLQFSAEYEDIKAISAQHSQDASNKDENKLKNRYINILPFDHSLVKLSSNGEEDGQDYINANYLPGYKSQREYIGCQGPIPGTIDDFWQMIWEQNVSVVVMLTLCKEGQKVKCEQYWPDELKEPKQYGDIIVEVQSYSNIKTYDYRIFTLTVGNKQMNVKHFHFLSWMDFSANVQTGIMIDFIKQVRSHVQPPDTAGPMIVHCSAGVGRTGTYITLDHLMQFVDDHDVSDSTVDIFDMVLNLRENRPHMVQTEQQYIFIHDCLKEIVEKKRQSQIYQNLGFEAEENIYQNQEQIPMYENFKFGQEPRTNL